MRSRRSPSSAVARCSPVGSPAGVVAFGSRSRPRTSAEPEYRNVVGSGADAHHRAPATAEHVQRGSEPLDSFEFVLHTAVTYLSTPAAATPLAQAPRLARLARTAGP